jgi:hypothetical protein
MKEKDWTECIESDWRNERNESLKSKEVKNLLSNIHA